MKLLVVQRLSCGEDVDRDELIAELQAAGVRHTPEKILRIARKPDGSIVFLETGDGRAGWEHIRAEHASHFAERGIPEDQIMDAVMAAVTSGAIRGTQGRNRTIYQLVFNGETQYISVSVSSNGYIVGANPTPQKLIRRLTGER